jgi:hypothetical protein
MGSQLLLIVRRYHRYELSVSCQKLLSCDESDVTSRRVMNDPSKEKR